MESAAESTAVSAPPNQSFTLGSVLESMQAREEFLESPDFDPAAFVGELDPMKDIERLKMKIENTIAVIEDAEQYAERMTARAQKYLKKSIAARNKADQIRDYVQFQMEQHKFEKLPGVQFCFIRKRSSNPRLCLAREAQPADHLKWPSLVRMVPRKYEFINAEVKATLKRPDNSEFDVTELAALGEIASLEYSYSLQIDDMDKAIASKKKKAAP